MVSDEWPAIATKTLVYALVVKITFLGITKIGKLNSNDENTFVFCVAFLGNISTGIMIDAVCFACFKFNCVHFCRLIVIFLRALS